MASTFAESEFALRMSRALVLDLPYTERLLRPASASAAVLALFAPQFRAGDPALLLIKRAEATHPGDLHGGQMAFPGGRAEHDELNDLSRTALRETDEEVGISASQVRVLGKLPNLTSISHYEVHPFVGLSETPASEVLLRLDKAEVAEAVWIPWSFFEDPSNYKKEMISRGAVRFPTHVFQYRDYRIWGATGAMIKNLLDRWTNSGDLRQNGEPNE